MSIIKFDCAFDAHHLVPSHTNLLRCRRWERPRGNGRLTRNHGPRLMSRKLASVGN